MTNPTNNTTHTPPSPIIHQGQPTHESIRNLIAANFKPQVPPTPPPLRHEHENQLQQEHTHQQGANSSSSSSTSTSYTPPRNRVKSNSISVGVLSRSAATHKRVSFSNLASGNTSQVFLSSSGSDNSENEIYSDDEYEAEEEQDTPQDSASLMMKQDSSEVFLREPNFKGFKKQQQHPHQQPSSTSAQKSPQLEQLDRSHTPILRKSNVKFTAGSMTPSPNTLSPTSSSVSLKQKKKKPSSMRYNYNQYGGEKLALSKSLDSQLLEPCDSNSSVNSYLPEFNKRPPTDTPIVSTMGSPMTREQSEYEDDDDDDDEVEHQRDINPIEEEECDSSTREDQATPILHKTKNISHLNLSEMDKSEGEVENKESSPVPDASPSSRKEAALYAAKKIMGNNKATAAPGSVGSTGPLHSVPSRSPPRVLVNDKSNLISPMSSVLTISSEDGEKSKGLVMAKNMKDHLLKDVPDYMKEEFEKTPSVEKLKNLLMTKPPPSARKTYTLNIPGQTSSKTSPDGKIASVDIGSKLVIVMVGLPARGKSYITNKLTRYLNWLQHDCRVFNVGNTRRKDKLNAGPETQPLPDSSTPTETRSPTEARSPQQHDAAFFNPDNKDSTALREKWAMDTLDQLLDYVITGTGSVGIFDATNSTKARRRRILKKIQDRSNGELKVLFLESVCSDPNIIESNIRLKLSGPDYKDMDPKVALDDFVGRLHNYEKAYQTIDEEEEKVPGFQYVKMIDVGKKVVSYNIKGFLASQTIYFLLNFNLCERQIWITRHGESTDNLTGRIGGDAHLTKRGIKFSKALTQFMDFQRQEFRKQQLERFSTRLELKYNSIFNEDDVATLDSIPSEPNFCVWTSMLTRAVETGQYFNDQLYSIKQLRMLNELGGGKYEGMTYEEIQSKHPKEFESRIKSKLTYRYPGVGGESYLDVLTRLRPLIAEVERTTDHLLIVSHRVVSRILLAYFLNLDKSAIGELDVPLHTLYCLELKPYGTDYTMYEYDENLDWFVKAEPEHQKNVKEVGVVFRERKYSVVPTAPPSSLRSRTSSYSVAANNGFNNGASSRDMKDEIRRRLSMGVSNKPTLLTRDGDDKSITAKNLQDLKNLRKPAGIKPTRTPDYV
ncbi:6-phosphofructo-2-kinase 1 [Candida viswanathii]|uniref:6-phosphofructo-2-kinase 1 n=1 Tax=Candida viswanathii TaxID=5486 RepID=A0A367YCG1_9ASCO|nr:6-phosphofructo-2-kinase 1 [Candida viswanathii]